MVGAFDGVEATSNLFCMLCAVKVLNKLFLDKDNFIDNGKKLQVCKSTITNRYIKGGHFSIQIQVSDLGEKKKKKNYVMCRGVQLNRWPDPPGKSDRTRTDRRPTRLLRRSVMGYLL